MTVNHKQAKSTVSELPKRQSKAKNNKSELLLKAILENSQVGIFSLSALYDGEGRIADFIFDLTNQLAIKSLNRANLTGKRYRKEFKGHGAEVLFAHYAEVTVTGIPWKEEFHYVTEEHDCWLDITATKLEDGCLIMFNDITNLKELNEDLRKEIVQRSKDLLRNRELLETMAESLPVCLTAFKSVRNESGELMDLEMLFANKNALDIAHILNPVGKKFSEEFRDTNSPELLKNYFQVIETGQMTDDEIHLDEGRFKGCYRSIALKMGDGIIVSQEDITARKNAEQKIREQSEFIENITRTIPDSISVVALPSRKLEYLNRLVPWNYSEEDAKKIPVDDRISHFVKVEDQPAILEYYEKLGKLKDEEIATVEYRSADHHGKRLWYRVRGKIIKRDEEGRPVRSLMIGQDITTEKLAEQQIMEQNYFISGITEAVPDMISVIELPSRITSYTNHEPFNRQGFNLEEMAKMSWQEKMDLIHPEDRPALDTYFDNLARLDNDQVATTEYRAKNLQNTWLWFRARGKVFKRNGDGTVASCVNVIQNITAYKEADEKINEQAYFIKKITESIPDIITVAEVPVPIVRYISRDPLEILAFNREEILRLPLAERKNYIHPEDYHKLGRYYESFLHMTDNGVATVQFRGMNKKKQWRWFLSHGKIFQRDEKGIPVSSVNIIRDITDQMSAEAAFKEEKVRNQELQRINELMDTFVYAAAHDLKAPISNLKLITEIIETTQNKETRLQLQNRYGPIIKTLDGTISGLVEVLSMEKEAGSTAVELSLQSIYNKISTELFDKISEAEPAIDFDFSACPSIVYIESYMTSIFRNLISNSLKYRSRIRKLTLHITSSRENNNVVLTFADNGIGINMKVFEKDLFRPFKRFSSLSEGSGLGLHLVKNIVTKNGGNIKAMSESGKGTIFKVNLVEY